MKTLLIIVGALFYLAGRILMDRAINSDLQQRSSLNLNAAGLIAANIGALLLFVSILISIN